MDDSEDDGGSLEEDEEDDVFCIGSKAAVAAVTAVATLFWTGTTVGDLWSWRGGDETLVLVGTGATGRVVASDDSTAKSWSFPSSSARTAAAIVATRSEEKLRRGAKGVESLRACSDADISADEDWDGKAACEA